MRGRPEPPRVNSDGTMPETTLRAPRHRGATMGGVSRDCSSHRQQSHRDMIRALAASGSWPAWAETAAALMCRANPALLPFLIAADAASRHYVALCLAALPFPRDEQRPALQRLAHVIAVHPRRRLLTDLWGYDLGAPRLLRRLEPAPFSSRGAYHELACALGDPLRRSAFARAGDDLSADHIGNLLHAAPDTLRRFHPEAVARVGDGLLAYLFETLRGGQAAAEHERDEESGSGTPREFGEDDADRRKSDVNQEEAHDAYGEERPMHGRCRDSGSADDGCGAPSPGDRAILRRLNQIARLKQDLNNLVATALKDHPFPEPPGPPDQRFQPIRTITAMKRAGLTFRNCLGRPALWGAALRGEQTFMIMTNPTPLIVGLARDRLTGVWSLDRIAGPRNRPAGVEATRSVIEAFSRIGVRRRPTDAFLFVGRP